ncbi:MAG: DUF983 domain-containing protein [Gemmatimonadota bacterium]
MPPEDRPRPDPIQLSPGRAATFLLRGIRLRCPNCGGGPLFSKWVKMRASCPRCHLLLDRGEHDYFLGGYTINFVVAELLIVVGGAASIVITWPDVPWTLITWLLVAAMVLAPVLFYPFAKTLWLAVDLVLRPLTLSDLAGHGENQGTVLPEQLRGSGP